MPSTPISRNLKPSATRSTTTTLSINPQDSSPLFTRLPIELRLVIYEHVLHPTKTRSLYLTKDVWTWADPKTRRTFLNVFLVCRKMYDEAVDILYTRHELLLYSAHWALQTRVGALRDYTQVCQRAQRMRLTLFVTGDRAKDDVLIALLGWVKAVLAERERALQLLTLEFCAISPTLEYKPTAVLYAAQGFRSLGPTKFLYQCGFSGVASETAMEALMRHANEKVRSPSPSPPMGREEAFEKYLVAWKKSQPSGSVDHQVARVESSPLMSVRFLSVPKMLSNRWFRTTFDI